MINHSLCSLTPQFIHTSPNHIVRSQLWTRLSHVGRCFTFDQALCEVFEHSLKTDLVLFATATSTCILSFVGYLFRFRYFSLLSLECLLYTTFAFYWYLLVFSEYLTIWSEDDPKIHAIRHPCARPQSADGFIRGEGCGAMAFRVSSREDIARHQGNGPDMGKGWKGLIDSICYLNQSVGTNAYNRSLPLRFAAIPTVPSSKTSLHQKQSLADTCPTTRLPASWLASQAGSWQAQQK